MKLSPGARVLDLCSGTALHGQLLAQNQPVAPLVVSVDSSGPMVAAAARAARTYKLENHVVVQADARTLRLLNPSDGAMCIAALHLIDDQAGLMTNLASQLRPGSPFVGYTVFRNPQVETALTASVFNRAGFFLHSRKEIEEMLSAAGFAPVEMNEHRHALMFACTRND
jgi:trans-aconitate methyltransferase